MEDSRTSDYELIVRLRNGEIGAFDALFDKYRRGLLAYVRGMTGDEGLAEDVVQDSFLQFVHRIDRINPKQGASGWLYRTARNRAIDVLRHRKFETLPGDESLERAQEDVALSPAGRLMQNEDHRAVEAALRELPEAEREILVLRFYAGLKFREIAGVVGRPLGTVLWRGKRGLQILREILGER